MSTLYRTALIACILLFASTCGGGPVSGPEEAAVPELDLYKQPVADAPDPADRAGAASDYVECTYGLSNGGWSMDFGPSGSASNPEGALARFLDDGLFSLPGKGYVIAGKAEGRMLYTYSVAGTPKVAVIVADGDAAELEGSDGWVVETFANCDPAEYDPSADEQLSVQVWLDGEGNRVPTSVVTSLQGAEHCGWESVTYLIYQDRQYISDPRGVLDVPFVVPFDDDAELPADAVDTGYRQDDRQFWISADGTVAYLVGDESVEAWPTPDTADPVWCS